MDRDQKQPAVAPVATELTEPTEAQARREFIKRVSKASAAAPAVALLMAASFKDAKAADPSGGSGSGSS